MGQKPELDPVNIATGAIQRFDDARHRGIESHLLEGNGCEINEEDRKKERLEEPIKSFFEEVKERVGGIDEISREEKEQWNMK